MHLKQIIEGSDFANLNIPVKPTKFYYFFYTFKQIKTYILAQY